MNSSGDSVMVLWRVLPLAGESSHRRRTPWSSIATSRTLVETRSLALGGGESARLSAPSALQSRHSRAPPQPRRDRQATKA